MKVVCLIFFFCCPFINSAVLKCIFDIDRWFILPQNYQCLLEKPRNFFLDRLNRTIDEITGKHINSSANANVEVLKIYHSNVYYFPRDLERFFPNLTGIGIAYSKLKEIRSEDLKPFTELIALDLDCNQLEVIMKDLFQFNQKLKGISLKNNHFVHINPNVFDNFINQLSKLLMSGSICPFNENANNNQGANQLIRKIQSGNCNCAEKLMEFVAEGVVFKIEEQIMEKIEGITDELMKVKAELANLNFSKNQQKA